MLNTMLKDDVSTTTILRQCVITGKRRIQTNRNTERSGYTQLDLQLVTPLLHYLTIITEQCYYIQLLWFHTNTLRTTYSRSRDKRNPWTLFQIARYWQSFQKFIKLRKYNILNLFNNKIPQRRMIYRKTILYCTTVTDYNMKIKYYLTVCDINLTGQCRANGGRYSGYFNYYARLHSQWRHFNFLQQGKRFGEPT